ncbi:uncharacterized protein LOC107305009 isoform X2 [Oryza brachyantha]|uniref:uncharacterized protein LOC107305009 isoform X2 n=1 Tax=Oryza brachyantha TaxID=4533 RepID=UPI00077628CC|nr:uncharacterized protein LOC107305009 isoform X2 [Oryza brachyantha]
MDPTGESNYVKATPAWSIPSYGIPDHHQQGSGVHGLAPQNGPPHDLQADAAKLCKPLDVDPLTMASPDEPVTYTPEWLLNHPAYSFGWRVYQYEKKTTGVKYKTYKNPIYGTIRSKVSVNLIMEIMLPRRQVS